MGDMSFVSTLPIRASISGLKAASAIASKILTLFRISIPTLREAADRSAPARSEEFAVREVRARINYKN